MKSRTRRVLNITLLLMFILSGMVCAYAETANHQSTLLTVFSQIVVAHGVWMFALLSASFTFIIRMIEYVNGKILFWKVLLFVLIGGILLGLAFYIGFRFVWYSSLTNKAIYTLSSLNETLGDYVGRLKAAVYTEECIIPLTHFESYKRLGLPFSFTLGFLVAYIVLYVFCKNEIFERSIDKICGKIPLSVVFFFLPAFSFGAILYYFSDPLFYEQVLSSNTLIIVWLLSILVLVIYYSNFPFKCVRKIVRENV